MLFTSVGSQHAACCYQPDSFGLWRNNVWLHRRCAMVQPRRHTPVQVLAAEKQASTSSAGAGSKSSSSTNTSNSCFFHNRERELKLLAEYCSAQPRAISLILGPRSAGKTALLQDYMSGRDLNDSRCFINARVTPISTPNDLARVLLESAVPNLARTVFQDLRQIADLGKLLATGLSVQDKLKLPGGMEVTGNAAQILKALAGEQAPALSKVTATYVALLDAWYKARASGKLSDASPPVLVIDEANALMSWDDQYRTERRDLLRFFVDISKASNRSHVVLATSEYAFQTWLTTEIGPGFYDTFVIGDFPAKEAREFLDKCLQQVGDPEVSNTDWKVVHKVCGGNAGALVRAAGFYHLLGGWEAALTQLTKDMFLSMKPGYTPAANAGYTATDYATAVKTILESPYNVVDEQQLMAQLGKQAVDAMVQAYLLALRPYSSWATDIAVEAFGPDKDFTVVTAPTTLHLFLMERHRSMLLKPLDDQQVPAQANADSSTPPNRPPSPTSEALRFVNDDIKALQGTIEGVEGQIQQVSRNISAIREAKGEGWQDELACLQQDKQQLAEEKRQLREEGRLLQEQKLLLMKREE